MTQALLSCCGRSLVEEEAVDVNLRDTWDAVPLYYACLAGTLSHDSASNGLSPTVKACVGPALEKLLMNSQQYVGNLGRLCKLCLMSVDEHVIACSKTRLAKQVAK